jgi:hypothetical protein
MMKDVGECITEAPSHGLPIFGNHLCISVQWGIVLTHTKNQEKNIPSGTAGADATYN